MPAWPILQNRYQVLKLIGRGGYSEVYKVNICIYLGIRFKKFN